MRSIPMYLLLPLMAVAGTAIPVDPARAQGTACKRVAVQAKADAPAALAPKKTAWRPTLEAL